MYHESLSGVEKLGEPEEEMQRNTRSGQILRLPVRFKIKTTEFPSYSFLLCSVLLKIALFGCSLLLNV